MTTRLKIKNVEGPLSVNVWRGFLASSEQDWITQLSPNEECEVYVWQDTHITIKEVPNSVKDI